MKPTLLQLREQYGLNLKDLARVAGVDEEVVYAMLMGHAVTRDEAELILRGVERMTGKHYKVCDIAASIARDA